ncbi:MAG: lipocalin family protein [Thermoanaerobaculaceae bacterium]|jgi:apolipoprotein D and lipocalin family protein|nr:lipocalin family protein [Thermoanaerobaculaceae bacterium]
MIVRAAFCGIAGLALAVAPALAKDPPLKVVPTVDLSRYAGVWYEIGRLPNRFQKKCAGDVTATYTVRPDGTVTVRNQCRRQDGEPIEAEGLARPVKGEPSSVLRVRFAPAFLSFLPFVWGDYRIMALADDYSHVLVGTSNRTYLWVLAREPQLPEPTLAKLLETAREQGFDVTGFQLTAHRPAT